MVDYFLIADIGGTNSNIALVEFSRKDYKIIFQKKIPTISYNSIENMLNTYIDICNDTYNITPENALISVAGKVEKGRAKLTNGILIIDSKEIIKKTILTKVEIINDFVAISYSIEKLNKKYIKILNKGRVEKENPISLIGAGTGLGKAILIPDVSKKDEYLIVSSEGGHGDFPVQNEEELELINFLKKELKRDYIEYEDIISGRGIENIYKFLQFQFTGVANELCAEKICENKKKDPISRKTFKYFYKFYARASKNLVLETLSFGGLYLAGGIIEKNIEFSKKDFMVEFTNNTIFEKSLKDVPIYILKDYDVSLFGLINYINKNIRK